MARGRFKTTRLRVLMVVGVLVAALAAAVFIALPASAVFSQQPDAPSPPTPTSDPPVDVQGCDGCSFGGGCCRGGPGSCCGLVY